MLKFSTLLTHLLNLCLDTHVLESVICPLIEQRQAPEKQFVNNDNDNDEGNDADVKGFRTYERTVDTNASLNINAEEIKDI